jgi:hypothetical protein
MYPNPLNYVEEETGEKLRRQVLQMLQQEAEENKWDPLGDVFGDVVYACSPILTSRFIDEATGKPEGAPNLTAAFYAVEAVRDFLISQADSIATRSASRAKAIRNQAGDFTVREDLQGFIVHHPTREMVAVFKANCDDLYNKQMPTEIGNFQSATVTRLEICKWSVAADDLYAVAEEQSYHNTYVNNARTEEEEKAAAEMNREFVKVTIAKVPRPQQRRSRSSSKSSVQSRQPGQTSWSDPSTARNRSSSRIRDTADVMSHRSKRAPSSLLPTLTPQERGRRTAREAMNPSGREANPSQSSRNSRLESSQGRRYGEGPSQR